MTEITVVSGPDHENLESKQLALVQFKYLHTVARLCINQTKCRGYEKQHSAWYSINTPYLQSLTTIFTMASFSRSSPVNCDVEFNTENIENKTAIVTGGRYLSNTPSYSPKTELNYDYRCKRTW
jgi:lysozyme family protein